MYTLELVQSIWSNCRSNRAHRLESSRKRHLNASVLGEPTTPNAYFLNINTPNGRKKRTKSSEHIPSCCPCWRVGSWSDNMGDGLGREEEKMVQPRWRAGCNMRNCGPQRGGRRPGSWVRGQVKIWGRRNQAYQREQGDRRTTLGWDGCQILLDEVHHGCCQADGHHPLPLGPTPGHCWTLPRISPWFIRELRLGRTDPSPLSFLCKLSPRHPFIVYYPSIKGRKLEEPQLDAHHRPGSGAEHVVVCWGYHNRWSCICTQFVNGFHSQKQLSGPLTA